MNLFSQKTVTINWAGSLSSSGNDSISFLQVDQEGNVYMAGNFENELDLNVDTLKDNIKKSHGGKDIYITKTNVFGNQAWSKVIGGTGLDSIMGLSIINEKIYLICYFQNEVDFGLIKITSTGNFAYFIATLDLSGNVLDVKTIQSENDKIYTFAKVVNDNLVFTGTTTNGSVFVEKRNLVGDIVWLKHFGANENVQLVAIANDEQANIYFTGNFNGINIDFDPSAAEVKLTSSADYQDGFLMKLNANGDFVWVKQIDGIKNDFITSLAVRGDDILLSGRFEERIKFGETSMLSKGSADFFVAQYNLNGELKWARQFGGNKQSDDAKSIVIDRNRNVYITGVFIGEGFEIGNGTAADKSVLNINGKTSRDAFLIQIDSLGTTRYTTRFGGAGKDFGAALAIDTNFNVVVCGLFDSGSSFENPKLTGKGLRDVFIIKLNTSILTNCSNPTATITPQGNTSFCQGDYVNLNASTGVNYSYEWYNNDQLINGASYATYKATTSGKYTVKVIDGTCSTISSVTIVFVNPNPTASITQQGNTTFCQGGFVNLVAKGGTSYQWNTGSSNSTISANQSGTYTVNVFNSFGCQATASQLVTVNTNPNVTFQGLNQFTLKNESPIQLVSSPSGGTFIGEGIQGSTFNPTNVSLGKKTISYNYTSPQGCSGTISLSTIVVDSIGNVCNVTTYDTILKLKFKLTTGINSNQYTSLSLYPNPTTDVLNIAISDAKAFNGYRYRILDAVGKEVYNELVKNNITEISLKTIGVAGMYLFEIVDQQNNTIQSKKIVLE